MDMHFEWNAGAMASRRIALGGAIALVLMTAPPAPTADAKQIGQTVACKARGTSARLEVRCPTATVAELLVALQQATGLRSEYPSDLARTRVSITTVRASLPEVLDRALSGFNYAIWTDGQGSSSVTWLKIVDVRRTVESAGQTSEPQGIAMPAADAVLASRVTSSPAEVFPAPEGTTTAAPSPPDVALASAPVTRSLRGLSPPSNSASMKQELEKFARSVTPTNNPLEPPPIDPASRMPPVSTSPVIMPGVEMPR